MKNLTHLLVGLFLVSLALASCKKDEKSTPKNYFKVGGKTYTIVTGSLENYGMDTDTTDNWEYEGYNLDLVLFTKGLTISPNLNGYLNVDGQGEILYFEVLTSNGQGLDEREYPYDPSDSPSHLGTFDYADYSLTWVDNVNEDEWTRITSGKLTVSKSGSNYTVKIDCMDEDGNSVEASYTGALEYYNYEGLFLKSASLYSLPAKFGRK